jgi:hypothetical protein
MTIQSNPSNETPSREGQTYSKDRTEEKKTSEKARDEEDEEDEEGEKKEKEDNR